MLLIKHVQNDQDNVWCSRKLPAVITILQGACEARYTNTDQDNGIEDKRTHHELKLVHVLGLAAAVLDLLGEEEADVKEEEAPLAAFADDLLGVPDREGVLQEDLAQRLQTLLQTVQHGQVHGVVGLLRHVHHHLQAVLKRKTQLL